MQKNCKHAPTDKTLKHFEMGRSQEGKRDTLHCAILSISAYSLRLYRQENTLFKAKQKNKKELK